MTIRPPLPSGVAEGGVNTGRGCRSEIVLRTCCHDELVAFGIVITEQILTAAHVAEEEEHVSVADGPKSKDTRRHRRLKCTYHLR